MVFRTTDFGKALQMAMTDKGYSCIDLSARSGRSPRKISELRNTMMSVSMITMLDLARGLNMPLSELLKYGELKQPGKDDENTS